MAESKMKVETAGNELKYSRLFQAPRRLVFEAYSSCEHLKHWWGPRTWPMAECTMDFRVGGSWHYCLRGPEEGDESWGLAKYHEIVEPERLAYTDYFADSEGEPNLGMPQVHSTMEFIDLGDRTELRVRAVYETAEALQTVLDMGMIQGMSETLDRLDEHLARVQTAAS